MPETTSKLKIVYLTPALYMAGGVERVLTLKANYFAEHCGYDISIILTEGKDKPLFYPLSERVRIINLNIGFEELWTCSFLKKIVVYLKKQRQYRKMVEQELMRLRPDITISLLRREINFLTSIKDGSKKIGELHVNRANYRNYNTEKVGLVKRLFARWWSYSLLQKLRKLDQLVVLTEKDRVAWTELDNVVAIPDPLPFVPSSVSQLDKKRVVAIARYSHEKGIDLLLKAWAIAEKKVEDWQLEIFGDGDKTSFEQLIDTLGIDRTRCWLNGRTDDVEQEYLNSSLFVLSSRFEGFGMVIVEAMACGLPVVAFDCPWGPRSIISDGEDGLLVENGNVEALADALSRLIGDEVLRQSMAEKAIVNVKRFEIETIANQWLHVFNNVMNEKK
ncbi:MAG: glycosyltransferase family 4 protein [Prevotella sp.]|nr:glycosyltransferase family 4 protein [Prevotella sp.]